MLTGAYKKFTQCLMSSSEKVCQATRKRVRAWKSKPGRSEYVKDKHIDKHITAINSYRS